MTREEAFAEGEVWAGEARTEPHVFSGWHHHGEHTTVGRVLEGAIRFEFGADARSVDAYTGDFFLVPPHTVHREGNPADGEQVVMVVRWGSGPTVFNVEGPGGS